jgi:hypothetical protein
MGKKLGPNHWHVERFLPCEDIVQDLNVLIEESENHGVKHKPSASDSDSEWIKTEVPSMEKDPAVAEEIQD